MTHLPRSSLGIAVGGLIALAAAMGVGRFVYTPILPFMLDGLGLTKAEAGVIASANFLGYLLGALTAAATLPGSRRTWLLAALALSAMTTAAMGLTTSLSLYLVLRFVGGVASAFVMVFASAIVLDGLAVAGRNGLLSVHFAGVGCGIVASAVIVAALAAGGFGWQTQWLFGGAATLLALAAVAWLIPTDGPMARRPVAVTEAGVDHRLVALIVAYGLFGFGYVITATFISTQVSDAPALRSVEPLVWPIVGLTAAPSVALWSWIGRRWGSARGFAIACVVEGVGVALSVLTTSPAAVLAAAALLGGTFVGITALGLMHATQLSRGDPRRSLALLTVAFGLGQMIGPTVAGLAYDAAGSLLAPSLAAAAALAVAALLVTAGGGINLDRSLRRSPRRQFSAVDSGQRPAARRSRRRQKSTGRSPGASR